MRRPKPDPTGDTASDINRGREPAPGRVHIGPANGWAMCRHERGLVRVSGSAFDDRDFLNGTSLATYLARVGDVPNSLRRLNGFFAVIWESPERVWAAVDRVRSIPLFYGQSHRGVFISPDARWVREQFGTPQDEIARAEFLLTGYVTGCETLHAAVKQLRAGELLVVDYPVRSPPKLRTESYYEFRHDIGPNRTPDNWSRIHGEIVEETFERLLASTEGRPIAIPLSGGYDSRLIALMLHRVERQDVYCFSYGRRDNAESRTAREIAERLGFRWAFIPYDEERWAAWFQSKERREYYALADGLSSLPNLQDWPAVGEMRRLSLIPEETIFVPGHTGDFISGGHIPLPLARHRRPGLSALTRFVAEKHYRLNSWSELNGDVCTQIRTRLTDGFGAWEIGSPEDMASAFEWWEWRERQAKFICNSVRVYDYWRYDWRMPLWDSQIMDFWTTVPLQHRRERCLFRRYVDELGSPFGFPAANPKSSFARMGSRLLRQTGLTGLRRRFEEIENRIRWRSVYGRHPLAWYGLVPVDIFDSLYTGKEHLFSFLVREYLGHIAFQQ